MFLLSIYVGVALGFSFVCSIAEAVLLSVTPSYIGILEQQGKKVLARRLRQLKEDINTPLAAILSLNTIAHTGGAAGAGAQAAKVFGDEYLGVISGILTFAILVFSEIIPKTLGAHYWKGLAGVTAITLRYLIIIFYPFVFMTKILTKKMGGGHQLRGFNREEFAAMAELSTKEGMLHADELAILKNLLYFKSFQVKDIATPRTVVFAIDATMTVGQYFTEFGQERFSRIPIYEEDHEHIVGFVLRNELLIAQSQGQSELPVSKFKRPIHAVPESLSLSQVFQLFLTRRDQMMIVIDEHGGLEGIVTLEDTLEKLIGKDIIDEFDTTSNMRKKARKLSRLRHKNLEQT